MSRLLAGFFVVALVVAGGYWYRVAESKCDVPVVYDIGDIDERFGLSREDARAAVTDAESLWEDATGKNLFTYEAGASFTVNFVYDERQEKTEAEGELREVLDAKEEFSDDIREQYDSLRGKYEKLRATYENRVDDYERALAAYNSDVELWNEKGGAPPQVYADLEVTKERLEGESEELDSTARELNRLVDGINALGEQGNRAVSDYNSNVAWYNSIFGEDREFTQGDYQGDRINIYQFRDGGELRRVLAHELGHALSLDHVDDDHGVMYYLMEGTLADLALSAADLAEYRRVCGAK